MACGIWVANGSRNEDEQTNGMSHFIEHMLFKGTTNRTASEIAEGIDSIGGDINAFTTKENTCYHTTTLTEHFESAFNILADMFFNSRFDNGEIEKERAVIMEEIDMYEDTPDDLAHQQLQSKIFEHQSLGYTILGTKDSISTFNHDTFKDFFAKRYNQDNVVISVAGNFDENQIIDIINKNFGDWKNQTTLNNDIVQTIYKPSMILTKKEIEQLHIEMSFEGIKRDHKDKYAIAILNNFFGSSMSSRLFQNIREKHGLAYSIYSFQNTYKDIGVFSIYAGLNSSHTEKLIKLIISEIKRLSTDKISKEQLEKTKVQIKSGILLSLESSRSRMTNIGMSVVSTGKIISPDETVKQIDAVTLDDVYRLVENIFDLDKVSLSAVGNIDGIDFERILQNAK